MRLFISSIIAKLINRVSQLLGFGAGFTWPGNAALYLYPRLLQDKRIHFKKGAVFITGTNGKTTTAALLSHILRSSGASVVRNTTGANLLNGVASSVLLESSFFGGVNADVGVFEIDELFLGRALKNIFPNIVVLLNLSRDQLDRSWEIDTVYDRWEDALKYLSANEPNTLLFVDSTQTRLVSLGKTYFKDAILFGVDQQNLRETSLFGDFNAKNVGAAVCVARAFGVTEKEIKKALNTFTPAYGRGEVIVNFEKSYKILLAKNPASFNNNLDYAFLDKGSYDTVFFVLNDNIPDGRDVSWIYDIDPWKLKDACLGKNIFVGGTRFLDMAVRLSYSGVPINEDQIGADLSKLISKINEGDVHKKILMLPNYSAMLKARAVLTGRKIL